MDWLGIITLFFANFGIILWLRAESKEDWRHMDVKMDKMDSEMKEFREIMHKETKEFHGRLYALEEKYLKKGK
jgi:hypothetical protein